MLIRNQFNKLFSSSALPVLEKIIFENYNKTADFIPKIMNVMPMDRDIVQSLQVSGLPAVPENPEGENLDYSELVQGYAKTYNALKYRLGVKITKEMIEDGKLIDMKKLAEELGKSMFTTRQVQGASVLNNGFSSSFNGPDGVPLFSASHPLFAVGGTDDNTDAADLAVSALRTAIIDMRDTRNAQGLRVPHMAKKLVVSISDQFLAAELINSVLKPGVSTNDANTLPGLEIVVCDYLNDSALDAWFLLSDSHDLNFFQRSPMEVMDDLDFDGDALKIQCRERFAVGFNDWRGSWGSSGA
jgi:hypothetical protein